MGSLSKESPISCGLVVYTSLWAVYSIYSQTPARRWKGKTLSCCVAAAMDCSGVRAIEARFFSVGFRV